MLIDSADLARLCYNAIQFSARDSSLGGVVMFNMLRGLQGDGSLSTVIEVYASDDYVAMVDTAPATVENGDIVFHLHLKELKELEKWLRDKEGELRLWFNDNALCVDTEPYGEPVGPTLQIVSEQPDFSGVVEVLEQRPNPFTGEFSPSADPFAIRAERFAKFRLLRTPESPSCRDGYPVDFLWDGRIIYWRCGPALRGVVGPLARRSYTTPTGVDVVGIEDLYAEEEGVLW